MHCGKGHWAARRSYLSLRCAPGSFAAILPTPVPIKSVLPPTRGDKLDLVAPRGDKLIALSPPASSVYASLFDARFSLGSWPGSFANSGLLQNDGNPPPLRSSLATARNTPDILPTPSRQQVAQNVILPAPRPTSAPTRKASLADSAHGNQTASDTPPAKPSIFATVFEKLFGKPAPIRLAYATTDDSGLGVGQVAAGRYDQWTAVYDISAHTVYMPDGTQLEAHSGLGSWLDDPNHANEKMRGVTPPNIYDLELREELFHGVRALRMIPETRRKSLAEPVYSLTALCLGRMAIRMAAYLSKTMMRSCKPT